MELNFCLKFRKFDEFIENVRKKVQIFFISQDYISEKHFGFFITMDGKAYGFGDNSTGQLGLGHSQKINNFVEISALYQQRISEFFEGPSCMFAKNEENSVFCWGGNLWGQLGRGHTSRPGIYLKPFQMKILRGINIIQIVCGEMHILALSENGMVYGWGCNEQGQLGCGKSKTQILSPILLTNMNSIIFIYCFKNKSIFIKENFDVYYSGEDISITPWKEKNKGIFKPELLKGIKASKLFCNNEMNYFIYANTLYKSENLSEKEIISDNVQDISLNEELDLIVQISKDVYVLISQDNKELAKTNCENFFEYYLKEYQRTYKSIIISHEFGIENKFEIPYTPRNFFIFRNFPTNFQKMIKHFYVSKYFYGFCVTNDDKVYGFGRNLIKLGFSLCENENIELPELCYKNIEEFFEGKDCMFAKNDSNEIFSWGKNNYGQFNETGDAYFKPQLIKFFEKKDIIFLSCDNKNCFGISSDGVFYGISKQISFNLNFLKEQKLNNIKLILSSYPIEFSHEANSENFILFALGCDNIVQGLGIKDNRYENKSNLFNHQIFWKEYLNLTRINELITSCDESENSIKDLYINGNKIICETNNYLYIYFDNEIEKTIYKSIFEYILYEEQKTYKTIHMKNNKSYYVELLNKNSGNFIKNCKEIFQEDYILPYKDENIKNLKRFRIFNDLRLRIESNVKSYYESSNDYSNYFGFYVMNDDKFYVYGSNVDGKLGLGHNKQVYEYQEVRELTGQHIEEFFEGKHFMFARNSSSQIFSWGLNIRELLLSEHQDQNNKYLKPQRIRIFDNKNIIKISCGLSNCIALSSEGIVYCWGNNKLRQIGFGRDENITSLPIIMDLNAKTRFIDCFKNYSYAVTIDGNVYYWENSINNFEKFEFPPKLIPIKFATKICNYKSNLYILASNGILYKYDSLKDTTIEIKFHLEFIDLYEDTECLLLQSEDYVYQFDGNGYLTKTNFLNFYDFYTQKSSKFKNTIFITKDGYLMTKEIKLNQNNDLIIEFNYLLNNKYEKTFEEISEIGWGTYGVVLKVKRNSNSDEDFYAIKRIEMKGELDLKEIQILSKLDSDFVVQYIDSWFEQHFNLGNIRKYLYIQMEFCSHNLKEIIDIMKEIFDKPFQIFIYYLSCELFKEFIESVNYLHSKNIIHRQLKPENVLLSSGINGRFIKLCDFNSSTLHKISVHTLIKSAKYLAPEVFTSKHYNVKSDIYSLALIATELFQFEDNIEQIRHEFESSKYLEKYLSTNLEKYCKILLTELSRCFNTDDFHLRPNCVELLSKYNLFSVPKDEILQNLNRLSFLKTLEKKENLILKNVFVTKIN